MNVNTVLNFGLLEGKEGAQKIYRLDNAALGAYDPYDPNLPEEIKVAILAEIEQNIWYYFREVVRFRGNEGQAIVPMINEVVYNLLSGAESVKHTYVTAPRLTFKTSALLTATTWFILRGIQVQMVSFSEEQMTALFDKIRDFIILPEFVREHLNIQMVALEETGAEAQVLVVSEYEFVEPTGLFKLTEEKNFSLILFESVASSVPTNFELVQTNFVENGGNLNYQESTIESLGLPQDWVDAMRKNLDGDERFIQSEIFLNRYYEQATEVLEEE